MLFRSLEPIAPSDRPDFDEHEEAQDIADGWLEAEKIGLTHGGDRACYSPLFDTITMPEGTDFTTREHYYQTLFHEIIHSSGHEKRLKRLESIGLSVAGAIILLLLGIVVQMGK